MYKSFEEILLYAKKYKPTVICVAAAEDDEILKALNETGRMGLTEAVLVGNQDKIQELIRINNLEGVFKIHHASSEEDSVKKAIFLVKTGEADVLMKGLVNSSVFMRGVLRKEEGLCTGQRISHMACYEIPQYEKLLFCTDSGINVAPELDGKRDILLNAIQALNSMGYKEPMVVLLAANELVDLKVDATRDAGELMVDYRKGAFKNCYMEGPMAFDVAFSREAAIHKGIESKLSGNVDLILCPAIEVGNALGKSWIHFNRAKWAGVVLGASKPILMGSRSDTFEVKINGIGLVCLMNGLRKEME